MFAKKSTDSSQRESERFDDDASKNILDGKYTHRSVIVVVFHHRTEDEVRSDPASCIAHPKIGRILRADNRLAVVVSTRFALNDARTSSHIVDRQPRWTELCAVADAAQCSIQTAGFYF